MFKDNYMNIFFIIIFITVIMVLQFAGPKRYFM